MLKYFFSRIGPKIDYTKDYYKILKIPNTADQAQIRIHYYKLATRYHPDSQTANAEKYQNVQEAFRILSDMEYKQKYDTKRETTTVDQQQIKQEVIQNKEEQKQEPSTTSDQCWEVKLVVKQGEIQHQFFFNETKLLKKSTDRTELEQAAYNMIENLNINDAAYNDYVNSKGSAITLGQLLEIAGLIAMILLRVKK